MVGAHISRLRVSLKRFSQKGLTRVLLTSLVWLSGAAATLAADFTIDVGVVQRFGEQPSDRLVLRDGGGGTLTVTFEGGDGTPQTQQLEDLTLELVTQPLSEPVLEERVVLSTHRSFENAEQEARDWRDRGIEVEIAQPSDIWQVWAHRDVYQTPLLRRLLIETLERQGVEIAYLNNQVRDRRYQAGWEADGFRYNRDRLSVSASSGTIQVTTDRVQRTYGGQMQLQPNAYGSYTLVNTVPIETYLRGVVPHEIGPNAPYAAVEAQAIIARTYALRNLHRFAIDEYELCADTHCQVYWGLDNTVSRADQAIAATSGLVLTYNNEPIDALYSSTTGGVTSPFEDVWLGESRPYLVARVDAPTSIWDLANNPLNYEENFRKFMTLQEGFNESDWNTFRWRESTSLEEMTEFLKRYYRRNNRAINFKEVQEVAIVERSPSGRVLKMTITTDAGVIEIPNDEIRNAFYPPISTFFYIEPMYDEDDEDEDEQVLDGYTFVGGGFGHGVGLSQTGSYNLANLGWSSAEILEFYYPGTQLQPLAEISDFFQDR
ncbi:SpoIID/LytB domain-containing protein [Sodalinema gerasimenkoae]|uniref:SpoIID/LytB domain-containing protein n=1 Tax=Sodalinema gerasimenkoae TaxID=2862348 RepID=UPI001357272B|nr:SpoIID/LytB domain-containing protein [Sodalinema gerasimenkoae]